jgi:hypothetical protein
MRVSNLTWRGSEKRRHEISNINIIMVVLSMMIHSLATIATDIYLE